MSGGRAASLDAGIPVVVVTGYPGTGGYVGGVKGSVNCGDGWGGGQGRAGKLRQRFIL